MMGKNKPGFTIIETMLFLGITGLMDVGILGSAGGSINTQRYSDSVSSLQAFLQQQYTEVTNVANSRNSSWKCNSLGIAPVVGAAGTPRGQSDCVILGKLITNDGNNKLLARDIIGLTPVSLAGLDDTNVFKAYPNGYGTIISNINQQEYEVGWGASIANANRDDFNFSVMMLRSPVSGLIKTYVDGSAAVESSNIQAKLIDVTAASDQDLKMCVNPKGLFSGKPMAVTIMAGASGPNGVGSLGDGESGCN